VNDCRGARWRLSLPENVDQLLLGDNVVPSQDQGGQQPAVAGAAYGYTPIGVPNLHRAKDSEVHECSLVEDEACISGLAPVTASDLYGAKVNPLPWSEPPRVPSLLFRRNGMTIVARFGRCGRRVAG
jgi:hypothetical protein